MTVEQEGREAAERTLKPMLAEVIQEAAHLAFLRSVELTPEQRERAEQDIFAIPAAAMADMDPMAFCQNLACVLLGTGGWFLPDSQGGEVYTGNATAREVFDLSFVRPDRDFGSEMAWDVLRMMDRAEEGDDSDA